MHYDKQGKLRALFAKKVTVHAVFLILVGAIVVQGQAMAKFDNSSILATFISGEEDVSGPLSQAAYAEGNISESRLSATAGSQDLSEAAIDDPTLMVGATLTGNVMAPLAPSIEPTEEKDLEKPSTPVAKPTEYAVAEGDTIGSIAAKFNVSTNTILWANKLNDSSTIRPGDKLTIPPTTGVLYQVKSGDTILSIANKFDVKALEIVDYNQLGDSSRIALGQELMIPGGEIEEQPVVTRRPTVADNDDEPVNLPTPPKNIAKGGWLWPTATRHMSQYFGGRHTGLDIDNRSANVPIFAAKDGVAEFAGWNSGGYGNLVVVDHGSGLSTFYGHASKILVKPGTKVSKGQVIAIMGSTGRSTGPHLHFEIRRNGRPVNPLGMF